MAEAVLAAASEAADKEDLKQVSEIKVRVGELQGIELEILQFAFSQLKKGRFKNAKFTTRTIEATFKCRACNSTWTFNKNKVDEVVAEAIHFIPEVAHTYMKCPKCGSPDFEITEGRGVWLETIKGER